MQTDKKLTILKMAIYYIIFLIIWSIRELIIRPIFLDTLNDIGFQIAESFIKILIWTLPAILLIKYYKNDLWINGIDLIFNKSKWFERKNHEVKPKWYDLEKQFETWPLIGFFLLLLILPFRALLINGELVIHQSFIPIKLIEIVLFVGLTEEIVFRGWLLNGMLNKFNQWSAILINSALFTIVHFPIWIYFSYNPIEILSNCVGVFFIGIILCLIFIKSKNIIIPIVFHMIWNLLLSLFFGMK